MDLSTLEDLIRRVMREEMEKSRVAVDPVLLTRVQAAQALNIGLTKVKELISSGALLVVKVGDRTLVPVEEVKRFARPSAPQARARGKRAPARYNPKAEAQRARDWLHDRYTRKR